MASNLKLISASAAIAAGKRRMKSVTIAAGADAATVTVDDSTDGSGTDKLALAAAIGTTATWRTGDSDGVPFSAGIYATITGTTPSVSVEYD